MFCRAGSRSRKRERKKMMLKILRSSIPFIAVVALLLVLVLEASPTSAKTSPTAGTWQFTGSMSSSRAFFTATRLNNGKVLVAGGEYNQTQVSTATAELYDPRTGAWSLTGSMNVA